MNQHPESPTKGIPWRTVALVTVFALIVRGGVLLAGGDRLRADPDGYRQLAKNPVMGAEDDYPGFLTDAASAYRPPLYPLALTASSGWRDVSAATVGWLHLILGVATVWCVYWLGRSWRLQHTAWLAPVLVACDPILLNQSTLVMTETLATFLAAIGLVALTRAGNTPNRKNMFYSGVVLAAAALCRPVFLVWLVAAAAGIPLARASRDRWVIHTTVLVLGAALVIAPWGLRNLTHGHAVITTTHGGYTLLLGNNPEFYDYLRERTWGLLWEPTEFHESWDASRHRNFIDKANVATISNYHGTTLQAQVWQDEHAYRLAWENIRNEPEMFAYACLVRVGRLWGLVPHQLTSDESMTTRLLRYAVGAWYLGLYLLAALGMFSLGKQLRRSPWLWGMLLCLSITAVHTLYWSNLRMRAPAIPVVALLAAAGALRLARGPLYNPWCQQELAE